MIRSDQMAWINQAPACMIIIQDNDTERRIVITAQHTMASVAPRSAALLQSRLPKARSSPPSNQKSDGSPKRRMQVRAEGQARSTAPSEIPIARGKGAAAAMAGMARSERRQRLGAGSGAAAGARRGGGSAASSRRTPGSECSSSDDDEQHRAPLQERRNGRGPAAPTGPTSAPPIERPMSAAGPRPGTASSMGGDVDPRYQGELSRAAIVASSHEEDMTKIYELKLRGASIERIENLGSLRKLRHLDLSGNKISRVEGLESLVDLRELKLFANRLSVIEGLENCAGLRTLSLQHNVITKIDGLTKLTKLQQLRLDNNLIEKIENLNPNTALTHLNLSCNRITRVEGMLSLALLEELQLNDNEIVEISKLPGRSLVELSLADNRLGEPFEDPMPGAKKRSCLSGLAAAKKLTALDLSGNALQGELACQLPKLLSLETLNLDSNELETLGGIAELCPELDLLEIRSNEICDPTLGGSLPLTLTELALSSNPLTLTDTWRSDVCRAFPSLEQLDEAAAEVGAVAGVAGGIGARPGTAGARGVNKPLMRPPSATTDTLSTMIGEEALEAAGAGLSARLAALKATLSAGDTPRAWVQTLPKTSVMHAGAVAPVGGAVAIQPPAAVAAAAAAKVSGTDLKAQLLAEPAAAEPRPGSGGRPGSGSRARRGISAALDYSRNAHAGDSDDDDDDDGAVANVFDQIDSADPAEAREAAWTEAVVSQRAREVSLLSPSTAAERRRRQAEAAGGEAEKRLGASDIASTFGLKTGPRVGTPDFGVE